MLGVPSPIKGISTLLDSTIGLDNFDTSIMMIEKDFFLIYN